MSERRRKLTSKDFNSDEMNAIEMLMKLRREKKLEKNTKTEKYNKNHERSDTIIYEEQYPTTSKNQYAPAINYKPLKKEENKIPKPVYTSYNYHPYTYAYIPRVMDGNVQPYKYCTCTTIIPWNVNECVKCFKERQKGKVLYSDGIYRSIKEGKTVECIDDSSLTLQNKVHEDKPKYNKKSVKASKPFKKSKKEESVSSSNIENILNDFEEHMNDSDCLSSSEFDIVQKSERTTMATPIDLYKDELINLVKRLDKIGENEITMQERVGFEEFLHNLDIYNTRRMPQNDNNEHSPDKRRKHVQSEHKRRLAINIGYKTLSKMIPNAKTKSKKMILYSAIKYILELKLALARAKKDKNE